MSLWPEPGGQTLDVDLWLTTLLLGHGACQLAHHGGDLSLRIAHARFARVVPNQVHERIVRNDRLCLGQAVVLALLWQDVALCNLYLLRLGVSRNLDDLHAVAQRRRNGVELIRGGNEEHLRKIELHLEVVVLEGCVLLRIEHFKKCRRRIAAEVRAELVNLIEHEDRILRARLLDPLHDATGERADIGSAVPTNLRLVVQATKAHAHKLAAHRASDRLTK